MIAASHGRRGARRAQLEQAPAASIPAPPGLRAAEFDDRGAEYAVFSYETGDLALPDGLTSAECAVLRGIHEGRSNAEIAKARGTSSRTIANQVKSLFNKLGVHSRTELVAALGRRASTRR